jgi:hypothetical protein
MLASRHCKGLYFMTTRWPARFVALMAAVSAILLATAPDADAARRARSLTYAEIKSKFVPMAFFIAKGEPNACGPGCDTWISAEGDFDDEAANRFRRFLREIGARDLPIIFNSRGGLLGQAILIGDNLYARRMTASVGRTSPVDCRRKSKAACDRLKDSGRELRSQLQTNGLCASACVYAVIGGVRRQIPARASVSVHAPKNFDNSPPAQRAEFYATVDRFIARAGVTPGLMKLTMSVPNTRIRELTRKELADFGIERSDPLVSWEYNGLGGDLRVKFTRKIEPGDRIVDAELRMQCRANGINVSYISSGAWAEARDNAVWLTIDSHIVKLSPATGRGAAAGWSATMPREAFLALATAQTLTIEHDDIPQSLSEISRTGLEAAMSEFKGFCPWPFLRAIDASPA